MNNRLAVMGVNDNAICFDFKEKVVYFFRKGWASKALKLVNIAIPFDRITAIELIRPTVQEAGRIALIVDGNRLLAEDQFENNASELSIGDSMYPAVAEAVDQILAECSHIQLVTNGQLNVPKTKNQKDYATTLAFIDFLNNGDEKATVVRTKGVSVGAALLILAIGLIAIYLFFKYLMA